MRELVLVSALAFPTPDRRPQSPLGAPKTPNKGRAGKEQVGKGRAGTGHPTREQTTAPLNRWKAEEGVQVEVRVRALTLASLTPDRGPRTPLRAPRTPRKGCADKQEVGKGQAGTGQPLVTKQSHPKMPW